jgi:hypothetical protein
MRETSSPSISSAGTAPKVPSPAWKTTIETMSVAARSQRTALTRRRKHLCGTSVLAPVLEAGGHPPRDRTPQDQRRADITGCVRFARIRLAARAAHSPTP